MASTTEVSPMLDKVQGVRILKLLEDAQHIDDFDILDLGTVSEAEGRFKGVIHHDGNEFVVRDNHAGKVASELALKGLLIANGRGITEVIVVKGGGIYTNDPGLRMVGTKADEGGNHTSKPMETRPLRDLPWEARTAARETLSRTA
jgi:hypothetical protein